MPGWNTTVQDYSPLISYSPFGAWSAGSNTSDPLYGYYNDGYTSSSTISAKASFQFNGSGVWIYGARRPNHGAYAVSLDGVTSTVNGTAESLFQTVLFGASGLTDGIHTVELVNLGGNPNTPSVDIDFITCENSQYKDEDLLQQMYVDATSRQWVYDTGWTVDGSTAHSTLPNATATLQFGGDHVDLYGQIGPSCGSFLVSLDDTTDPRTFNCSSTITRSHVLLYSADVSQRGNHSLKVINLASSGQSTLYLEQAVVVSSNDTSRNGPRPPPFGAQPTSQLFSKEAQIGIIVTFSLLLPLIGAICATLWLRRRRRRHVKRVIPDGSNRLSLEREQWNTKPEVQQQHGRPVLYLALPSPPAALPLSPSSTSTILRMPTQYKSPIVRAKSSPARIVRTESGTHVPMNTRRTAVPWLVIPTTGQRGEYNSPLTPGAPITPIYRSPVSAPRLLPPGLIAMYEPDLGLKPPRDEKRRRNRMSHPPPPNYWQATAQSP